MKIIGFNLSKILIEKKETYEGKVEVNQNIDIKEISKVSKDTIQITEEEVLKIDFAFMINYSKDSAKVEFAGNLLAIPEKDELRNILKSWKDKKIPDDLRVPLFNFIMLKCNIKALSLEDELCLPYHIPMPRLEPSKKD